MRVRSSRLIGVAAVLFAASMLGDLTGCAGMRDREAIKTERVLAASGFRMRLADTAEKLAHLETLPQRKLTPKQKDGELWYFYADASACKCIYAGPEDAYQRYQKLALQQEISEREEATAQMNEDASMNWGVYGPWVW